MLLRLGLFQIVAVWAVLRIVAIVLLMDYVKSKDDNRGSGYVTDSWEVAGIHTGGREVGSGQDGGAF